MPTLVLPDDAQRVMRPGAFFSLDDVKAVIPDLSIDPAVVEALAEVPFSPAVLGRCAKSHLLFPVVATFDEVADALNAPSRKGVRLEAPSAPGSGWELRREPEVTQPRWCLMARTTQPLLSNVYKYQQQIAALPPGIAVSSLGAYLTALLLQLRARRLRGGRLPLAPKGENLVTSSRTVNGGFVRMAVVGGLGSVKITVTTQSHDSMLAPRALFIVEQLPARVSRQPLRDWLVLQSDVG